MKRNLMIGLWVCAATLAGAQAAVMLTEKPHGPEGTAPATAASGFLETDLLAGSQVRGGAISGYFLARFTYTVTQAGLQMSVPLDAIFIDGFNELVAGFDGSLGSEDGGLDLDAHTDRLREIVNRRIGADVVQAIYATQIDYFRPNETRARSAARQAVIHGSDAGEKPEKKKPSGGH